MQLERPSSQQRMPTDAKRVFQGILFDVYQWQEVGYDGERHTFEKLTRPDTALVIPVTEDGRIIYSLEEQPGKAPFLGALGGRVDRGEDALTAAKRELLEESGYAAREWTLLEAAQPTSKIDWCIWTFIAKDCQRVADQDLDGAEKVELRFATFDDFTKIVLSESFGEDRLRTRFLEAEIDPRKKAELRRLFSNSYLGYETRR